MASKNAGSGPVVTETRVSKTKGNVVDPCASLS